MITLPFQTEKRYRIGFGLTFITGMALCTGGVGRTSEYGWNHPISVLGILFGVLALILGGSVLFRRAIGPIKSERTALLALLGIIVVKFILAAFYSLLP
jgi:hypothetical protein